MSSLNLRNLTIESAGGVRLVDALEFDLPEGTRLGLLGESGSGKSLTSLAITGLLNPNLTAVGSIKYGDIEIISASESALSAIRGSGIAIVFQDPLTSLDPVMKIGKQLSKPLALHQGLKGDELLTAIDSALAEVKISSPSRTAHSYPHEISGGERQRVALALALACRPKILIADEITTSLDVSIQAEILALLDSIIKDRGMSLIFITHDIAVAAQIVDQVIILHNGSLVESGSLHQVLKSPKSDYAATLIASARFLDETLSGIRNGKIQ